jgi:hypothetical protein
MSVTLEPIYGLPTLHVVKDHLPVGILIPPQAPDDLWEYWPDPDWTPQRFASAEEACSALGIIPTPEAIAA